MIHNISYRTFVYGTEDEEKVMTAISHLFPTLLPEKTINEDYFGNEIVILTEKITKKRNCKEFIALMNDKLSEKDKNIIKEELERRIDEKGNLFLRFNKQSLIDEKIELTYSGDAIHVKIKIASYPVSKENAIKIAHKLFNFL
ncbi:MAG: exosome protein [Methanosphaera sp. rholeuAM270]|nr:MAG: exosome protein [Methanosphaera sp. rholeuAM270]